MTEHGRRLRTTVVSLLLLASASLYFLLSVLMVPPETTVARAAHPWPDGAEYLDVGVALARGDGPWIHVGGRDLPSRYPVGYPSLVAVAIRSGVPVEEAPHVVNRLAAALLLLVVGGIGWRLGGPLVGSLAAAMLATFPAFVVLARSPLSEMTATVPSVCGLWLLWAATRPTDASEGAGRRHLWRGAAGAFLVGISASIRLASALLLPFFLTATWLRMGRGRRLAWSAIPVLLVATLFGLAPLFLYNARILGDPLANGYGFWLSDWTVERDFAGGFAIANVTSLARDVFEIENDYTVASIFGTGSYLGTAFCVLLTTGLAALMRDRRWTAFLAAAAGHSLLVLSYRFSDDARFLFPLVACALPAAALGIVRLASSRHHRLPAAVLTLLTVAMLLGWPDRNGDASALVMLRPSPRIEPAWVAASKFAALRPEGPRLVFTDMAPPYLHARSPSDTLVAPIDDDHLYRHAAAGTFSFQGPQREALLEEALATGREVWVVAASTPLDSALGMLPVDDDRWRWEIVSRGGISAGLARLVEVGAPATPAPEPSMQLPAALD